ncbi:MAG: hypothetical protein GEU75_01780 [Dehalococcoidia bacterium]|nr:hypothetical protein [Dehalococcoidia bacterium]
MDGIDATNCDGQDAYVTLTGPTAGAELVSAGPIVIAGATVTVPITTPVLASAVIDVHVAITGDDPSP